MPITREPLTPILANDRTNQLVSENTRSHYPVTELLLKVDNPLLIVLTPFLPKNYWWRDRCGILTLRSDNALMWNSDHLPSTIEISYKDFRQEASGWNVYLAYLKAHKRTWYELECPKWKTTQGEVVFSVEACDFSFGDFEKCQ